MMKVLTLIQAYKICGTNRCRKQFLDPAALSTDIGLCQTDESNERYYYPSFIQVSSINFEKQQQEQNTFLDQRKGII